MRELTSSNKSGLTITRPKLHRSIDIFGLYFICWGFIQSMYSKSDAFQEEEWNICWGLLTVASPLSNIANASLVYGISLGKKLD